MVAMREWYRRTEALWPEEARVPTPEEAIRGARKLYRFVRGRKCSLPVRLTSGNRRTCVERGFLWVNPNCRDGRGGWRSLVHDLGHSLGGGHSKEHARLESRMVKEVIRRGWLNAPAIAEPVLPRETPEDEARKRIEKKLAATRAAIVRWESKRKRADRALRKLGRRLKYYERKETP